MKNKAAFLKRHLNGIIQRDVNDIENIPKKLSLKEKLKHWHWARRGLALGAAKFMNTLENSACVWLGVKTKCKIEKINFLRNESKGYGRTGWSERRESSNDGLSWDVWDHAPRGPSIVCSTPAALPQWNLVRTIKRSEKYLGNLSSWHNPSAPKLLYGLWAPSLQFYSGVLPGWW